MKKNAVIIAGLMVLGIGAMTGRSATTINPAHPYAYGANIGWINAYADGTNGSPKRHFL